MARPIDGDSMELTIGGEVVEIRLLGINAPELRTVAGRESCPGRQAKEAMATLLAAGDLRFDGSEPDRFGRVLGGLTVAGRPVDGDMVAQGWALALWSGDDPDLVADLVAAMEGAAEAGVGMWGDDACGPPPARLEITGSQVDPPGRDDEHLDEEWIEITNPSADGIDLEGWSVADETTSNRFALPAVTLAPGATLRVHTGRGKSTADDLFLDHDQPVWSNRGETALVVDPDGRIAAHLFIVG